VQRVLQALAEQTLSPDAYEVIVSIDGSEDGTREMVAHFAAPYNLRAVWQPNRGRAAACNAGIRVAQGELIVLLDDDMEPAPSFLTGHLQAHASTTHLGVMGAVPISFDQTSPPVLQYIGSKFNRHLETLAKPDHTFKLRDFYSGNFSIRREILIEVGGFDEAFKAYGHEDLELSLRLSGAGVRFAYSRQALAHQHYTKDFTALARDTMAKGRTALLLLSKHPETYSELKLSTYYQGSRKWRLLRTCLLELSSLWPSVPHTAILFMDWLGRRRPSELDLYYKLALDYFYWLGVRETLFEHDSPNRGLAALVKSPQKWQL
jgi:GT2 family glycosyltransferase